MVVETAPPVATGAPPPLRRRHPRLLAVLAVLIGISGALGLAEVALRMWEALRAAPIVPGVIEGPKDLRFKGRIKPNLDAVIRRHPTSGRDVRVRTNSLGLRGPEETRKAPGEIRVFVLGDSITFAEYLDEEETYPAILERTLAEAVPGRAVRVLNGGGPNVGTRDEAALLEELAPVVRPDIVLVAFYLNDGLRPVPYPDVIRLPVWIGWSRLADRASSLWARATHRTRHGARHRWVQEFSARRWVNDRTAFDRVIALAESDWGVAWHDYSWSVVEEGLERMIRLGHQHGFQVLMAAFPASVQVESRFEDDRPQRRARELASRLGLPFVDLLPVLRAAAAESLFYDHCHLTPHGNTLVAKALALFVARHALKLGSRTIQ